MIISSMENGNNNSVYQRTDKGSKRDSVYKDLSIILGN